MKAFLKKYIGLIISGIMIIIFVLACHLAPTNPKTAHVLVEIIAWYLTFIISLYVTFLLLKLLVWYIKKLRKYKKG